VSFSYSVSDIVCVSLSLSLVQAPAGGRECRSLLAVCKELCVRYPAVDQLLEGEADRVASGVGTPA
jgi:hypothetical protein